MTDEIKVTLSADASDLIAALKKSGVELKDFGDKAEDSGGKIKSSWENLKGLGGELGLTMGLGQAIGMVQEFGAASIQAARESAQANAQLEAVLKSTGNAAGMTKGELENLAGALQNTTNFSDEAVMGGESLLLTFTRIGKDVLPQATETMLDMSQAMGQDVKSSAVQLGKALNDPVEGIDALTRVGVTFTAAQKEQIAAMVEAGDVAGAQRAILAELNTEFGGSAEAARKAAGEAQNIAVAYGNLQENVGTLITNLSNLKVAGWGVAEIFQQMADGAAAYTYVFSEAIPAIQGHNQAIGEASGQALKAASSYEALDAAIVAGESNFEAMKTGLVGTTRSYTEYIGEVERLQRVNTENNGQYATTISLLAMSEEEYNQLRTTITATATATQQNAAAQQEAIMLQQGAASAAFAQSEAQAAVSVEAERWAGIAETNKQQLDALAQGHTMTAEQAKVYAEAQKEAAEAEQQRQEMMQGLLSSMADYYSGMADLQQGQAERESTFQGQMVGIREEAAAKQQEAAAGLTESLTQLEQERQDKIQWVLTGAHARTQQENDEALGYWNAHYDQLKNEAVTKNQEITAGIETEYQNRENAAAAARAKEAAEYEAHLEALKLKTALGVLETTGQLEQLTGLVGLKAGEAVELINAGVLPVTQEMGLAIQETLTGLQSQDSAVTATAQENQLLLQEAYGGTLAALDEQNTKLGVEMPASMGLVAASGKTMAEEMGLNLNQVQTATLEAEKKFTNVANVTLPGVKTQSAAASGEMVSGFTQAGNAGQGAGQKISSAMSQAKRNISDLIEKIEDATEAFYEMAEAARTAARAANGAGGAAAGSSGVGFASGTPEGGFVVPPGYPNDSFRVGLTSGERVFVEPVGQTRQLVSGQGGGGLSTTNTLLIQNVNLFEVQDPAHFFEAIQREAKIRGYQFAPVI